MRKFAYRMRHNVRDAIFRNNQPTLVNLRYAAYARHCRKHWSPSTANSSQPSAHAEQFRNEGFLVLPPASNCDFQGLKAKVDELFAIESNCFFVMDGLFRLVDGIRLLPELTSAIDRELEAVLEAYYHSHFKVFGIYVYRTLPNPKRPQSSFLWHIDNCPGPEIKLMVYLDEVTEETGALKLKNKSITDAIRAKGFRDREQVARVQDALNDRDTMSIVQGGPGTRILFENGGVLHKATAPIVGHRDVVTFVIIPSDISWAVHFARNQHLLSTNAGACVNPWTDSPEHVGYQY